MRRTSPAPASTTRRARRSSLELDAGVPEREPDDIGLPQQRWLLELWDEHGIEVPILDAADFLHAPETHLRPRETTLSDHDAAVAEACRPVYEALHGRRVEV